MREILFRGKRVDNGEWYEGSLIVSRAFGNCYITSEQSVRLNVDTPDNPPEYDMEEFTHEVIPETVGQYTGLRCALKKEGFNKAGDYNKYQDIYEGDIIQFIAKTSFMTGKELMGEKFVVVYQADLGGGFVLKHISVYKKQNGCNEMIDGWCAITPYSFSNFINHIEVIGNIHDKEA